MGQSGAGAACSDSTLSGTSFNGVPAACAAHLKQVWREERLADPGPQPALGALTAVALSQRLCGLLNNAGLLLWAHVSLQAEACCR